MVPVSDSSGDYLEPGDPTGINAMQDLNSTNEGSSPASATTTPAVWKGKMLYLFSGPLRPADGFDLYCRQLGFQCQCVDTEISPSHNLLDVDVAEVLDRDLAHYDGRLLSPPCSSFSPARKAGDGGPRPLRSVEGPSRYGFSDLSPAEKEKVRVGNALAIRSANVARRSQATHKPWILEQPHHDAERGKTSTFNLDEFQDLIKNPGSFQI